LFLFGKDSGMEKTFLQRTGFIIKTSLGKWWERDPFRQGAVIGYYALFALPGLLVVVIISVGFFIGEEAISGHLHEQIAEVMGKNTADQVQRMVMMSMNIKDSFWGIIIGVTSILFGATGVFVQLQNSFNIIWEVKAKTSGSGISGILRFLRVRLLSFGLILTIAFLLLISLVVSSLLTALSSWIVEHWSESFLLLFQILNAGLSFVVITLIFAIMFKAIPDAKVRWKSVWIGAIVTAFLFLIGKTALGYYFGKTNPASVYGVAGSVVLILLWTSYSSMIVFLGAEFTRTHSDTHFGEVTPVKHAVVEKGRIK
jgi:membrane protein